MPYCFLVQNFAEIGQLVDDLWPKKRFLRWRPPPSWILKILIFGHVTATGFNIWYSVPNFIKIGRFLTEIWRFNDFQNGGRPPSWILKKLQFLSCSPCRHAVLLAEIRQSFDELWPKRDFQHNGRRHLEFLKIQFLVTWLSLGSISAVVYQIWSKSDDFSLRYGDLAVFKMAAVRHLGFVMTSQYCIAWHIFVVQILSWNFLSIGVVVSEILAIS